MHVCDICSWLPCPACAVTTGHYRRPPSRVSTNRVPTRPHPPSPSVSLPPPQSSRAALPPRPWQPPPPLTLPTRSQHLPTPHSGRRSNRRRTAVPSRLRARRPRTLRPAPLPIHNPSPVLHTSRPRHPPFGAVSSPVEPMSQSGLRPSRYTCGQSTDPLPSLRIRRERGILYPAPKRGSFPQVCKAVWKPLRPVWARGNTPQGGTLEGRVIHRGRASETH